MKQIQPFQKHWLQITSIVVCRLNLKHSLRSYYSKRAKYRFEAYVIIRRECHYLLMNQSMSPRQPILGLLSWGPIFALKSVQLIWSLGIPKVWSMDIQLPSCSGLSKMRGYQGAVSIRKTVLPGMAIPMLKIRRPNGRLIFNMEIAIRR